MDYFILGLLAATVTTGATLGASVLAYRRKSPITMPRRAPRFCWLPKYALEIEVPDSIVCSEDPIAELDQHLERFGFRETFRDDSKVKFSRVSILGNFAANLAKVNLVFSLPLTHDIKIVVEYGGIAPFDMGNLWKFMDELRSKFELEYES